ncbi:pinin [Scaptodrosophila lebanonensis]|uniref:Pinin n=1 Tax=Drosophila lebanonensis TaxID=7225 RepID=A0A6J2TWK1_DROLE|nr:pinin [Scaptodrosophila lebanonensis]
MEDEYCLSSVVDLEQKLNSAKQSLVILNENIRRFVGRDLRGEKYKIDGEVSDKQSHRHEFIRPKRRMYDDPKSLFNRLTTGNNEECRPRINSRVIRELPSKKEVVEAQGTDSESRARNRRMFGSLLGTLQKFCQEESRLKQKEDKKAKIEKKLEKQELQERALLKKQRESLFLDRKRKQFEIKRLELKMARVKDFNVWESSMMAYQKHQIRTKTKPHLFFQPKTHSCLTEQLLLKSKTEIEGIILKRRQELQAELKDLHSSHYIDEEYGTYESGADESHAHVESGNTNINCELSLNCDKNTKENKLKISKEKSISRSIMIVQEA